MGIVVTFNATNFQAMFPQFNTVSDAILTNFVLPFAQQIVRNDGGGPVSDAVSQANLLNLAVAHICALLWGVNGQAPTPLVGRLTNATQGSVSLATEFTGYQNDAWYNQTPWGAMLVRMMRPFVSAKYYPPYRGRRYPYVGYTTGTWPL
jgi:hypothetical protein